jgi:hypothetical protein
MRRNVKEYREERVGREGGTERTKGEESNGEREGKRGK